MKKKSSKIPKILRFFCVALLGFTVTAHAVIPVVYWAGMLATAAFTAIVAQATFGSRTRALNIYAGKALGYTVDGLSDSSMRIVSKVYAIPAGSKNGVELELRTDQSALKNQIKNNPTTYPGITENLGGAPQTAMTAGSWGEGANYDESLTPSVGDIVVNGDKSYRITSITDCYNQNTCYANSQRGSWSFRNSAFRILGCGSKSCPEGSIAGAKDYHATQINNNDVPNWDELTDEQWSDAMRKNPAETKQAQQDLYNSLHGHQQNSFPPASSPAHLVYPGTNTVPNGTDILDTVEKSELTEATTGPAEPNTDELPPSTTTTTTRVRGEATVTTDPVTGARTVTYPTTVTVTDAEGNIITQHTEWFVGTYPAGVPLPTDVQAAVDGVTESETSTTTETEPLPLTTPAIADVDLSPIFTAADILRNKFPFAILGSVTDFLNSWYAEPQTPQFNMEISGHEFIVSFSLLDTFALWWRRFLRFIAMATAAYYAIRICFM